MADTAIAPAPAATPDTPAPAAALVTTAQPAAIPAAEPAWDGRTAATPTPAAVAPSPTALDPTAAPTPSTVPNWPDDWRQKMVAGVPEGDERTKALNLLQRLNDPEALLKKVREQERVISAGGVRKAPGADATPEQLTAYRQEIGIPDKPEGYYEKLTDGLVIGDEDRPLVDLFFENMHTKNASPEIVQTALDAYYQIQERAQEEFVNEQIQVKQNTVDALHTKWGGEFRANMNSVLNVIDGFFGSSSEAIRSAMLPDGTPLMNHLGALEGFAAMAREINPGAAVIPAGSGNIAASVDSELAKLNEDMRAPGGYERHMRSPDRQARMQQLTEAKMKMEARGQR